VHLLVDRNRQEEEVAGLSRRPDAELLFGQADIDLTLQFF
jgi:hypothetical protein